MRLQTKIGLIIIPTVMLVIIALGGWSIYQSNKSLTEYHYRYLRAKLDFFIEKEVVRRHELLKINRLEHIHSFVGQYQQNAIQAANNNEDLGPERHVIFSSNGQLVSDENGLVPDTLSRDLGILAMKLKQQGTRTASGRLETSHGDVSVYAVQYFEPWQWYVFLILDKEKAMAPTSAISKATMGMIAISSLVLIGLLWLFFNRYFATPFVKLRQAAEHIGRGDLVTNIGIHSKDEFGKFARDMELMAASIQNYRDKQQAWHEQLEELIRERTSELRNEIKERLKVEAELRVSEVRFKQLFDNMADGAGIFQAVDDGNDFVLIDINRKGQTISQVTRDKAVGALATEVFKPKDISGLLDVFRRVYATGRPEDLQLTLYSGGHSAQWIENYVFKLPSGLIVALYTDTTEKVRTENEKEKLQAQLRQAQKMEAVGTLAGGIAHDFNNLLQAIGGYTQIMLMSKKTDDPDHDHLLAIQKTGDRAASLVRQLLLFSRKADSEHKHLELNHEIDQARRILERTIPKMIDIEVHPADRLWGIMADQVQVEQILFNLGTNAADAMPDGGKLIVKTENVTLDKDYSLDQLSLQPGKYVLMTVTDTGLGMDQGTVDKIFEPFFTTKEIGKGTGLGLASVYGIVKSHGGHITCYSDLGQGTTFRIYFPASEPAGTDKAEECIPQSLQGGNETILLVDDEKSIRRFAKQALVKFGYTVLTAASGEEALEIYTKISEVIDLTVTDINMPGIGGHKFLVELLQIKPDAKVLVASGYSIDGQVRKTMEAGAAGYLAKPYQLTDLLGKVRNVLDYSG
jgi:signal transduction histidine kinase